MDLKLHIPSSRPDARPAMDLDLQVPQCPVLVLLCDYITFHLVALLSGVFMFERFCRSGSFMQQTMAPLKDNGCMGWVADPSLGSPC